ncbi:MAG TPA: hypothetical protein VII38_02010 [Polyangia bacterium]|jgi:hypothetical protein
MRHLTFSTLLAFALACAAGCTRSNLSIDGDGGDCLNCNTDLAVHHDGGDHHDGAIDLSRPGRDLSRPAEDLSGPRTCVSTCSHCGSGGACCPGAPNGCCASGEWCDNGKCRCGQNEACTQGDICATAGPIGGPGTSQCGSICCGATGPCPL